MRSTVTKEQKHKNKKTNSEDVEIMWGDQFNRFAFNIDFALETLFDASMKNSSFSCCYFLFMVIISDVEALQNLALRNTNNRKIHVYLMACILISIKYSEIYPIQLEDIIENIDETVSIQEVVDCQSMILSMNNFTEYYFDNQSSFLNYFAIIFSWNADSLNLGLFIL